MSLATVRREIDRAIAERRLDAPERYVHVQVARLAKALRLADASIERGDLKAVGPLVRLVAALDRYHGLGTATRTSTRRRPLPRRRLRPPPLALPAPPLALTDAKVAGRDDPLPDRVRHGHHAEAVMAGRDGYPRRSISSLSPSDNQLIS